MASGNEIPLNINTERLAHWQQNGAQLSPTVARLVKGAPPGRLKRTDSGLK